MGHHDWVSYDEIQSHKIYTSTSESFTMAPFIFKGKIFTSGEKFISSESEHV